MKNNILEIIHCITQMWFLLIPDIYLLGIKIKMQMLDVLKPLI